MPDGAGQFGELHTPSFLYSGLCCTRRQCTNCVRVRVQERQTLVPFRCSFPRNTFLTSRVLCLGLLVRPKQLQKTHTNCALETGNSRRRLDASLLAVNFGLHRQRPETSSISWMGGHLPIEEAGFSAVSPQLSADNKLCANAQFRTEIFLSVNTQFLSLLRQKKLADISIIQSHCKFKWLVSQYLIPSQTHRNY